MGSGVNRRSLFQLAGAAALLRTRLAGAQQDKPQAPPEQPPARAWRPNSGGHPETFPGPDYRSTVAIAQGDDRRKNVYTALKLIDKQLAAKMKGKKYVVIKPNFVNTTNQLAASHADSMRGILDYLSESFKGPVVIAESSAGNTQDAYDNFKYAPLTSEYRRQQLKLIDLNNEAKFERVALLDSDLHIVPCRLAARLLDPEAFVISSCILKTHNTVIASLSIKNMVLGAPLHQATGETTRWNEKRKFHVGLRQTHYNMMVTAERLNWGASLIDGYEGMEGNGPNSGTPVASRIALASTDYVAADRTAAETHGHRPRVARLREVLRRSRPGPVRRQEDRRHRRQDRRREEVLSHASRYRARAEVQGPLKELPFNLGWVQALGYNRQA
ncbi:MAG: DUF362 domain-containing protein [Ignavibacteriota bacterium]